MRMHMHTHMHAACAVCTPSTTFHYLPLPSTCHCSVPLYLMGHSLGGSLALTLWGAELLPATHTGRVTVVALAAPNPQPKPNPEPNPQPKPEPEPNPHPKPNPKPNP